MVWTQKDLQLLQFHSHMCCEKNGLSTAQKKIIFLVQRHFKTIECTATSNGYMMCSDDFLTCQDILFKIHSFISNLSYDRSTASSKTIPPLNAI
jgi:hypothetical protein